MEALRVLFTSGAGLLTIAIIAFLIAMGVYLQRRITKLMNDKPGKEGWNKASPAPAAAASPPTTEQRGVLRHSARRDHQPATLDDRQPC